MFNLKGFSSILLFLFPLILFAEGTKELNPDSTNNKAILVINRGANYLGSTPQAPDRRRINIHIEDFLNEDIYIGFSQLCSENGTLLSTGTFYYQVFSPTGIPITDALTVNSSNANLKNWKNAFSNPKPLDPSGYTPYVFDLNAVGQNGDYYVLLSNAKSGTNLAPSTANCTVKFFDITVANTSTNQAIDGRVFNQAWALRTPCAAPQCTGGAYDQDFNGDLFVYTDCGFVSKMNFNNSGFRGLTFIIAVSDSGPGTTGNTVLDRMSLQNINGTRGQYRVFLNDPDINVYPTATEGGLLAPPSLVYPNFPCTDSELCISYEVSRSGFIECLVDLYPAGGDGDYTPGTEDLIISKFVGPSCTDGPYSGCLPWGAVDGLGAAVSDLSSVPLLLKFNQAPMHFMMYDVESNNPGWGISAVRPIPADYNARFYFDDRNISDSPYPGQPKYNMWIGSLAPYHIWEQNVPTGTDYGDINTINTWWYGNTDVLVRDAPGDCHVYIDDDGDGLPDIAEVYNGDDDLDGIADYEDPDFCLAFFEGVNGWSCASSGLPDPSGDMDNDGRPNYADADFPYCIGIINGICSNMDFDGDGIPNHLDLDSDNDGLPDLVEFGGLDIDGNGMVDDTLDIDNDGLADIYDTDPTDGPTGTNQCSPIPGCVNSNTTSSLLDSDGDGNSDVTQDFDGDGLPNHLDLDADNDGIPDLVEAGGTDTNGDGFVDDYDPGTGLFTNNDNNSNGLSDIYDASCSSILLSGNADSQNSFGVNNPTNILGAPDGANSTIGAAAYQSIGLTDFVPEGQIISISLTAALITDSLELTFSIGAAFDDTIYISPTTPGVPEIINIPAPPGGASLLSFTNISGSFDIDAISYSFNSSLCSGTVGYSLFLTGADINADGLPDSYPGNNFDNDSQLNFWDLDADNDGIPDVIESGGTDANGDGIADGFTDTDNDGFNDNVDADVNNDGNTENIANALLLTGADINADGLPDSYPNANTDGSSMPNFMDLDADGDGLLDVLEAGGTDPDNDGVIGTGPIVDIDGDGFSDIIDGDPGNLLISGDDSPGSNSASALALTNSDTDAYPNYLDIDSDNDGIVDILEAQSTSGYIPPTGNDSDGDGIDDAFDAAPGFGGEGLTAVNTDNSDLPDYLDLDSDNDGAPDLLEGHDFNNDGLSDTPPSGNDSDGDGLDDAYDIDNTALTNIGGADNAGQTPLSFPDTDNPSTSERDWREANSLYAIHDDNMTLVDIPVTGNVLTNDYDPEGDSLSINTLLVAGPSALAGTVSITSDGNYTFTPNPGFSGTAIFYYEVCDDNNPALCDTTSVSIIVIPVPTIIGNNPPIANYDDILTMVDIPISSSVIPNDFDVDGNNLIVNTNPLSAPVNGNVSLNSNGDYTYTPNSGFVGRDSFLYQVCDDGVPALCTNAWVYIIITPELNGPANDPPFAADDAYFSNEDTAVSGVLLLNDYDINGDIITANISPVANPINGTILIDVNGNFTYTPNLNFTGPDQFTYSICDNGIPALCDTATVYIVVFPFNDPPFAIVDTVYTTVDTPVSADVSLNDSDPDLGDVLTVNTSPITPPVNGILILNPSGQFTYTPNLGFTGVDSFSYEICDDAIPSLCDSAVVYIILNIPPIAGNDTFYSLINAPVLDNLLNNDSDPDLDIITLNTTPLTGPANGTVNLDPAGNFTYTPNPGFTGIDTFVYEICDDGFPNLCTQAEVYIVINTPPIALTDTVFTAINTSVSDSILLNDFDPDGNNLIVNTSPVLAPLDGSLILEPSGAFTYTPNPGFSGIDSFHYEICDDGFPVFCDQATVLIFVNGAITSNPDSVYTLINQSITGAVLTNDSDPEGDLLIVNTSPVNSPINGLVLLDSAGLFTYTPNPGFTGIDSFTYEVCDDAMISVCAQTLVVIFVNGPPTAFADSFFTIADVSIIDNLLPNDSDPEGNNLILSTSPVSGPPNGTLILDPTGAFTYTPNPGYTGLDSFSYEVCDNGIPSLCDSTTVLIVINTPPVAIQDIYYTVLNTPVSDSLLLNDYDIDADNLIINTNPITGPLNGSIIIDPSGAFTYTPNLGFNGLDSFSYEICDDGIPSLCAQVFSLIYLNIPPVALADSFFTIVDNPVINNVLSNDSEPDGENIIINTVPIQAPVNGTVTMDITGNFTYTSNPGYYGTDSFSYEICDDGTPLLCTQAVVSIFINAPPVALNDTAHVIIDMPFVGDVLPNDNDPNTEDNISVNTSPLQGPSNGTVLIENYGIYTYTPAPGFSGLDSFLYEICDNGVPSLCDSAVVYIIINAEPIVQNDSFYTIINQNVSGDLLTNDSDPNGNNLVVNTTTVAGPDFGSVIISTTGLFTYTPNPEFCGLDTFIYQVCDDGFLSLCSQAVVSIFVNCPPVATTDSFSLASNSSLINTILPNDSDPNGNNLIVTTTPVTAPINGVLILDPSGAFTYTPNPAFTGIDSFFYEVCDDGVPSLCDSAWVVITVANNAPIAQNDNFNTPAGNPAINTVITNDMDPDGNSLTVNPTPVTAPVNGVLVLDPSGAFTYTPNPAFTGIDSFFYEVCDDGVPSLCDSAWVVITVANNAPIAQNDNFNTPAGNPAINTVITNDMDPDGNSLTVSPTPVTAPVNGVLVLDPSGAFTYTPNPAFTGIDSFFYEVCDDGVPSLCDSAWVVISVNNNAPIAINDFNNTFIDIPVSGNMLSNDFDFDGDNLILNPALVFAPVNGSVTVNALGIYSYTPAFGFTGLDSFSYEICDDGIPSLCAEAIVYINVISISAANEPPVANPDFGISYMDVPFQSNLASNDFDPEGDALAVNITPLSGPTFGAVIINSGGGYTYTPALGFVGSDEFSYEICETSTLELHCDTATVFIMIFADYNGGGPNSPVAVDDANFTEVDIPVSGNVLVNDFDPAGSPISVNAFSGSSNNGTVIIASNGNYTYTPNPTYTGTDYFAYQICNGFGLCDSATVYIMISPSQNALPLQLLSFSGIVKGAVNHLYWEVQEAYDMNSFQIERSPNGLNFNTIGAISASQDFQGNYTYRFEDRSPLRSAYYRLRIIDIEGEYSFSKIIFLKQDIDTEAVLVHPNPATESINVIYNTQNETEVYYRLIDELGRVIFEKKEMAHAGSQNKHIEISHLSCGVYFLTVSTEEFKQVIRVLKVER